MVAAGVWTLPVLLGRGPALAIACGCMVAGWGASLLLTLNALSQAAAAVAAGALSGGAAAAVTGASAAGATAAAASAASVAVGSTGGGSAGSAGIVTITFLSLLSGKLLALAANVWRARYAPAAIDDAANAAMKPIGLGMVLLAAVS